MTAFSCFGSSWRGTGQDLDLWCEKDKQLQIIRAKANKLYKSLEMVFSIGGRRTVDGQRCLRQRSAGSPLLSVLRPFR